MPHKDTKAIVRFYYHWKKTRKADQVVERLALDARREPISVKSPGEKEEEESAAAVRRGRRAISKAERGSVCVNCGATEDVKVSCLLVDLPVAAPCQPCWATGGCSADARDNVVRRATGGCGTLSVRISATLAGPSLASGDAIRCAMPAPSPVQKPLCWLRVLTRSAPPWLARVQPSAIRPPKRRRPDFFKV